MCIVKPFPIISFTWPNTLPAQEFFVSSDSPLLALVRRELLNAKIGNGKISSQLRTLCDNQIQVSGPSSAEQPYPRQRKAAVLAVDEQMLDAMRAIFAERASVWLLEVEPFQMASQADPAHSAAQQHGALLAVELFIVPWAPWTPRLSKGKSLALGRGPCLAILSKI